ncbi:MAG TPA: hypothetical protein PLO27_03635 [Marmoricola sp.]|nr:hypothetical protein [Marmoricola sp.]HNI70386.1 hypothetical protein [Marmoricola sp.]
METRRLRLMAAGALMLGVLIAGCGSGTEGPKDNPAGSSQSVDQGATDNSTSAQDTPKFCDLLTAEQIGTAIGGTVTLNTGPFDACEFKQDDPRALSGSLGSSSLQENGGYEAYQAGSRAAMDDPTRTDLPGLGDAAYVDIGTVAGGSNLQVAGGVKVGDIIHTINLAQGNGMSAAQLTEISKKLLQLMLDAVNK